MAFSPPAWSSSANTPALGRRRRFALFVVPVVLIALGLAIDRFHLFPILQFAVQRTAAAMPSTTAVPAADAAKDLPLLSLYIDQRDLFDKTTGLIPNKLKHGRDWERPAAMSYFDGGRLLFATGVGVRIHGDISRRISPLLSFRLYFRRQYGEHEFRHGLIFGPSSQPVRHLVLQSDAFGEPEGRTWHFINPLAYDIARRMGCLTVDTKPVRFYVNGRFQGVYVMAEHISDEYLTAHFGHSNFNSSNRAYDELMAFLVMQRRLTMHTVASVVDLENMTRWFLSVLFCATEDTYQGAQLRDETRPGGKWFWINWDMDHSFLDYDNESAKGWDHDTFRHLLERIGERRRGRRLNEPRALIFTTLFAEDPDYRAYFEKLFVEVMNYRVTPAFLDERFEHYRQIAETYGVADRRYLEDLRTFLDRRPQFLRELAEQYLNTPPSVQCSLLTDEATHVAIDGFDVPANFKGYYFPGMTIALAAPAGSAPRFSYWMVDGHRLDGRNINVRLEHDTTITAVADRESLSTRIRSLQPSRVPAPLRALSARATKSNVEVVAAHE